MCVLVVDYQQIGVFIQFTGDGTFQEMNAKLIVSLYLKVVGIINATKSNGFRMRHITFKSKVGG